MDSKNLMIRDYLEKIRSWVLSVEDDVVSLDEGGSNLDSGPWITVQVLNNQLMSNRQARRFS